MDLIFVGIIGILFLISLIFIGVPIAFAMAFTGILGLWITEGPAPTLAHVALIPWDHGRDFIFVAIPLFILMGQIFFHAGLASDLYESLRKWVGRIPGGMAIASVLACGGFGAITGSSIATVATMGSIVMPEMKKYNYDPQLSTGVLAASGTLGILIPPSLIFIFYGVMTETSISKLFIAGIIPGILTIIMFSLIILIRCLFNPKLGPKGPKTSIKEKIYAIKNLGPVISLFVLIIGGIYLGIFTPTEAAGVGCIIVLLISLIKQRLTKRVFLSALKKTTLISSMIFLIIIGGYLIAKFLAITGITESIVDLMIYSEVGRISFLILLVILYIILGAMLDVLGMIVLTIPFLMPIIAQLGIDPIWFGVFVVIMAEVGLITPPIGANVFVMRRVAQDVPMSSIFLGIIPFFIGELFILALLIIWPEIPLILVNQMN